MNFKSLLNKLDSMEAPKSTPAAPQLDKAVQLNEDAQLRVLSGRTTYVAEAKKKADEEVAEEMKVGDKKKSATGGTIEKTATGIKHTAGKNYSGKAAEKDEKKKDEAVKESSDAQKAARSKFMDMVKSKKGQAALSTAKAQPKEKVSLKKAPWDDKKDESVKESKKEADGKLPSMAHIKKMCQDGKSVAEICKMHPDCNQKELKQMISDCKSKVEEGAKPDLNKDGKNDFKDVQIARRNASAKAGAKKTESAMMPKGKKRPVKESVEQKLSFKQMIQLVQESGGQQQIDPMDKALFNWAERVAKSKLGEGMKAELFAGLIYERNGGVFEMYDVLSEDSK
jgi:hypothetical protein